MPVKETQPQLRADSVTALASPARCDPPWRVASRWDAGHGRRDQRRRPARAELVGYTDWPGAHQVCRSERPITRLKTGEARTAVVYGITSLAPERATPDQLLRLVRDHWRIEKRCHSVRAVSFAEEQSLVRIGAIAHGLTTLYDYAAQHRHRSHSGNRL